jgi:hypothetical protein
MRYDSNSKEFLRSGVDQKVALWRRVACLLL